MVMAWQQRPEQLAWAEIGFPNYVVEGLTKYGYTAFARTLRKRLGRGLRGGREQFGELLSGMAARLSDQPGDGGDWRTGPSLGLRARCRGVAASVPDAVRCRTPNASRS